MAHVGIGSSHRQPVEDTLHLAVVAVETVVETQQMLVRLVPVRLVEDAQHLVQAVVYLSVQTWYLHDDAVVRQAVDERVRQSFGDHLAVVVIRLVVHVDHRLLDVAHLVAQQVDGHRGQGMVAIHVLRVGVVHA